MYGFGFLNWKVIRWPDTGLLELMRTLSPCGWWLIYSSVDEYKSEGLALLGQNLLCCEISLSQFTDVAVTFTQDSTREMYDMG